MRGGEGGEGLGTTFVAGKLKICSITFKYYGIVRTVFKKREVDALGNCLRDSRIYLRFSMRLNVKIYVKYFMRNTYKNCFMRKSDEKLLNKKN